MIKSPLKLWNKIALTGLGLAMVALSVPAMAESERPLNNDGGVCYFFKTFQGDQKGIYVHSDCLTQEGEDWISGKMVEGAEDLTSPTPMYYGYRASLRDSVLAGYDESVESEYSEFLRTGVDSEYTNQIFAQWMRRKNGFSKSMNLPAANGESSMKMLSLPHSNGETLRLMHLHRDVTYAVSQMSEEQVDLMLAAMADKGAQKINGEQSAIRKHIFVYLQLQVLLGGSELPSEVLEDSRSPEFISSLTDYIQSLKPQAAPAE